MTQRVCFVDWSRSTVQRREDLDGPLCGRATCLKAVSEYLAARGWDVHVLMPLPAPFTSSGVSWSAEPPAGKLGAPVFLRGLGSGLPGLAAARRFLWGRDLPHSGFVPDPKLLRAVHRTVFLSKYAERVWRAYYPGIGKSSIIPNGVEAGIYGTTGSRRWRRLIHVAHPCRGLKYLPGIWERIREQVEDVELLAYSDALGLHPGEGGDFSQEYQMCLSAGIELMPLVPQKELWQVMSTATASVFPTVYPEICSNTVLQTLACGCPIITTGNLGATSEWVQNERNGLLTAFGPWDGSVYREEMARAAVMLLTDQKLSDRLHLGALKTKVPTWDEVGAKWLRLLS